MYVATEAQAYVVGMEVRAAQFHAQRVAQVEFDRLVAGRSEVRGAPGSFQRRGRTERVDSYRRRTARRKRVQFRAGVRARLIRSHMHPRGPSGASGQRRAERDMLEREETRLFLLNYRRESFLIQGASD
jgi:hypothetical protein